MKIEVHDATATTARSRTHGPRRVLKELRRLVMKNARAAEHRAITAEERQWTARVGDTLKQLVDEGDQVLPGGEDPRDRRRARKRPMKLL
jgi:hypothetical protein